MKTYMLALLGLLFASLAPPSAAQTEPVLKAGAAKIDVTPSKANLPKSYLGVLDPLYARAIVIDDGKTRAAMVTLDVGGISPQLWEAVSKRAERELGIPSTQLIMTATHTHSAPFGAAPGLEDKVFGAIRAATNALQPARMAFGTGVSYININRNIIDKSTRRWWEGPNYEGPSDKTVAVLRFEALNGKPIGVYYNYAVHAVLAGNLDLISGDIPGAASTYIEDSLGDGAIAVWSTGAAGDQNPIYFQQTYDLRAIRIKDFAARGEDISNAMPPGGQGMDRKDPQVAKLMEQQKRMVLSLGQLLGEEVLHVSRSNMERTESWAPIAGATKTVTCPGRTRTDKGRAGYAGTYVDADPIGIRLSLLRIGDTVIGGVNAEVFNLIAQRFKKESPLKHTMMASLTNGMAGSGYIPNDAAYAFNTFEVISSRLKPGCAETAIVDGLLDLIQSTDTVAAN